MLTLGVSSKVQENMIIDIIERDMIIMPNKSKPLEHSNTTPASFAWAPTIATKSLAILGVCSLLLGFESVIVCHRVNFFTQIFYL